MRADLVGILELALPCDSTAPRLARLAVVDAVGDWCTNNQLDQLLIVVSELVSNAAWHTEAHCLLRVRGLPHDRIEIEVDDTDVPRRQPKRTEGQLGRGLGVVQQLTDRWGIQRTPDGKCVWAEIIWGGSS